MEVEKRAQENGSIAPTWLIWAREIQALAQTGCQYAGNEYNLERYQRLAEIAAKIVNQHTDLPYEPMLDVFRSQMGYATPRVDVRAAVFKDGKLLLVRERMDGGWTMPGGWADVGEGPSQAAEREVCEEAGFQVKAHKVIGVYDANRTGPLEIFHAYKILFHCDLLSGEARPSLETTEVAFYGQDEIPSHLSGERTKPRQIADAFHSLLDPSMPTVFD